MRNENLTFVQATKQMFEDCSLKPSDSMFARRIIEGVLSLAETFQRGRYSILVGRLIVAIFSRLARGSQPDKNFLNEVIKEIELIAQDCPYDEEDEKKRWISSRYPTSWCNDLYDYVKKCVPDGKSKNEKTSSEKFTGAPLFRDDGYGFDLLKSKIHFLDGYGFNKTEPIHFLDGYGFNKTERNFDDDIEREEKMDLQATTIEVIEDFCDIMELFTSLDVSNEVKKRGLSVRHRDVAEIVRKAFVDGILTNFGYVRDLITVHLSNGVSAQAYLYRHSTSSSDDYTDCSQVTTKVKKDDTKQVQQSAVNSTVQAPVTTATQFQPMTATVVRNQKGDGRLEIPKEWISSLGLYGHAYAIMDGNSLILKRYSSLGDNVIGEPIVDSDNRIRITNKILTAAGLNFGSGGQHTLTLESNEIIRVD